MRVESPLFSQVPVTAESLLGDPVARSLAPLAGGGAALRSAACRPLAIERIGLSEAGRPLLGMRIVGGPARVSVIAGAHADEPLGPRTAWILAFALASATAPWAATLREAASWWIVPHANPDGEVANWPWTGRSGGGHADYDAWSAGARREPPGRDVEFAFPPARGLRGARREADAVARFLDTAGGPFQVHVSLHSMAAAEGAWLLVGRGHASQALASGWADWWRRMAADAGLGLHDVDRHGEKGFTRLAPGLATTPRSEAMRDFFHGRGDPETAAKFGLNSMEYVCSLGGNPVCLVTELPMFALGGGGDAPGAVYGRWRSARVVGLGAADARARFGLRPVPWIDQARLQLGALGRAVGLAC